MSYLVYSITLFKNSLGLVPPARFERAASGLGIRRSVQLSYGGKGADAIYARIRGMINRKRFSVLTEGDDTVCSLPMSTRTVQMDRKTTETTISGAFTLDGAGRYEIETGIPFFNHMLELMTKHALFDCTLQADGDLAVDYHHTVEDVGIVLGKALSDALGDRTGIARYGYSLLPMDDAMAQVAVDLGGRPYLVYKIANRKRKIRDFDLGLIEHFFRSFCDQARMNLHIVQPYGDDVHHAYEAVFKGVARALYMACSLDARVKGVPSSKGSLLNQ